MGILIVDCVERPPARRPDGRPGDIGECFMEAFGGDEKRFKVWRACTEPAPPEGPYGGIVVSGAPVSTYDARPWIALVEDLVRKGAEQHIPILGVCFGHQLVAQALGGKVELNPAGREVGTVQVRLTDAGRRDPLFDGLGDGFDVMQSHRDVVTEPPPGARCLARSPLTEYQALALGDNIRTVQFHPEYTVERMEWIQRPRRGMLAAEGIDVDEVISGLRETPHARLVLRNFEKRFILNGPG